jgi:hypothetical protein
VLISYKLKLNAAVFPHIILIVYRDDGVGSAKRDDTDAVSVNAARNKHFQSVLRPFL